MKIGFWSYTIYGRHPYSKYESYDRSLVAASFTQTHVRAISQMLYKGIVTRQHDRRSCGSKYGCAVCYLLTLAIWRHCYLPMWSLCSWDRKYAGTVFYLLLNKDNVTYRCPRIHHSHWPHKGDVTCQCGLHSCGSKSRGIFRCHSPCKRCFPEMLCLPRFDRELVCTRNIHFDPVVG